MSTDEPAAVEGLTLPQLAAAAGLPFETAARYCEDFADHLIHAGPDHWAPINAALLLAIHGLAQAGYDTRAIRRELGAETALSSTESDGLAEQQAVMRQRRRRRQRPWWRRWWPW
jgi:hypothetical protein